MIDVYLVFSIISTLVSILYAVWERRNIKKNKALIYELQQLSLDSHYHIKILNAIILQNELSVCNMDALRGEIPPEAFQEMLKYKLKITCIEEPK